MAAFLLVAGGPAWEHGRMSAFASGRRVLQGLNGGGDRLFRAWLKTRDLFLGIRTVRMIRVSL